MKRTSVALAGVLTLSIGAYMAMPRSEACCGDGAVAAQGAAAAGSSVVSAISASTTSIVTMLTQIDLTLSNGFANLYTEMAKQTAASKTIENGAIASNYSLYLKDKQAKAQKDYELSPRACYEVNAASATDKAGTVVAMKVKSLNELMTERTLHTSNTAAAVAKIYSDHTSKYCSTEDVKLGRCSSAAADDLQNADVRAGNLLGENGSALTDDQLEAAEAFARNVSNPIPTQQIPKGWEKTEQGKAFVAGQLVEQARGSVAANSFSNMVAMRKVVSGLGTAAQLDTADVSTLQLIKTQVEARFLSTDWYNAIAAMSDTNLMREQNKMQAFDLWLASLRYAQMERIEAILATDLAMSVKHDSEDRLSKARLAAARSKASSN